MSTPEKIRSMLHNFDIDQFKLCHKLCIVMAIKYRGVLYKNSIRRFMLEDNQFMHRAIELALLAEQEGNLPVGAVISIGGRIVAEGKSAIWVPDFDATRHAEMEALRIVPQDLWNSSDDMSLYTTLEPCLMCFGAILLHGVGRVVFGSADSYGGASSVVSNLPTYFQERFASTQWLGPSMPSKCDPLYDRLLAMEQAKSR
jgi:tRNA(adenine34) deaminase